MSIAGVTHKLVTDAVRLLFGSTAATVASSICELGPCPLGLVAKFTRLPISDVKTVALSMYAHGIVSVSQEGGRQMVELNALPALILSAPSLLLDHVGALHEPKDGCAYAEALRAVMLNGIVEAAPHSAGAGFSAACDDLLKRGLLIRRVVDSRTFSTCDVFALERRMENLALAKKKTAGASEKDGAAKVAAPAEQEYTLTMNWPNVCAFLRGRYVVQAGQSFIRKNFSELLEDVLQSTHAADYSSYQREMEKDDESLRGARITLPRLEYQRLVSLLPVSQHEHLFDDLDDISASQLCLLRQGDGSYWDVTMAKAVRNLQLQYIESFLEQTYSPYLRRAFSYIRTLVVADTHQIEQGALLSEKDARNSMFTLAKLGFVQMQSIPRNSTDKMINPKSIFVWRYDENAAIEAYKTIIGEQARRFLARIESLHEEYENNEQVTVGNLTATKTNEKREKQLCCFNIAYADALKIFLLFSEM